MVAELSAARIGVAAPRSAPTAGPAGTVVTAPDDPGERTCPQSRPLATATGVWLAGGDQALLTDAYRGTAVQRELRRLLARGGVIGGTSAGAAVMSEPYASKGKGPRMLSK